MEGKKKKIHGGLGWKAETKMAQRMDGVNWGEEKEG